jgi:hypothetical protein
MLQRIADQRLKRRFYCRSGLIGRALNAIRTNAPSDVSTEFRFRGDGTAVVLIRHTVRRVIYAGSQIQSCGGLLAYLLKNRVV